MSAARKYVLLDYTRYNRLKQKLETIENGGQVQSVGDVSHSLPVTDKQIGNTEVLTVPSVVNGNGNVEEQRDNEQEIVLMFPKQVRQKCAILLRYLLDSGAVQWTGNKTLHINNKAIPGSNIIDVLRYCFFPKQYTPIGWHPFCSTLHHLNAPISILGNPVARQDVINGYSSTGMDDEGMVGYGQKVRASDAKRAKRINNLNYMQAYNINGVSTLPQSVINHRNQVSRGLDTFQQPVLQTNSIPNPPGLTQSEFDKLQQSNRRAIGAGRVRKIAGNLKNKSKQIKWLKV